MTYLYCRCHGLTDRALCSLSEYLWLASLDVAACPKLTDEGLNVLVSVCSGEGGRLSQTAIMLQSVVKQFALFGFPVLTGIEHLNFCKCHRVSDAAIRSIVRHCKALKMLNISDCPLISQACLHLLRAQRPGISITF